MEVFRPVGFRWEAAGLASFAQGIQSLQHKTLPDALNRRLIARKVFRLRDLPIQPGRTLCIGLEKHVSVPYSVGLRLTFAYQILKPLPFFGRQTYNVCSLACRWLLRLQWETSSTIGTRRFTTQ